MILDNLSQLFSWADLGASAPLVLGFIAPGRWLPKRDVDRVRTPASSPGSVDAAVPPIASPGAEPEASSRHRARMLSVTSEIEVGQEVEVGLAHDPEGKVVEARVLKVTEHFLIVATAGSTLALEQGTKIQVRFRRDHDGCYQFVSRVARTSEALPGLFAVSHTSELARRQTRRFVRVSVDREVQFASLSEAALLAWMLTAKSDGAARTGRAQMVDLSGGGCGLRAPQAVPRGSFMLLLMGFLFQDEPGAFVPAKVVDVYPVKTNGSPAYRVHTMFRHVPESLRRKIVKHVYEQQFREPV